MFHYRVYNLNSVHFLKKFLDLLTGLPVPIVAVTAGLSHDHYADDDMYVCAMQAIMIPWLWILWKCIELI